MLLHQADHCLQRRQEVLQELETPLLVMSFLGSLLFPVISRGDSQCCAQALFFVAFLYFCASMLRTVEKWQAFLLLVEPKHLPRGWACKSCSSPFTEQDLLRIQWRRSLVTFPGFPTLSEFCPSLNAGDSSLLSVLFHLGLLLCLTPSFLLLKQPYPKLLVW